MKKYFPLLTIAAIATVIFLSCKREYTVSAGVTGVGSSAFIKIVHASPNFSTIFLQPDKLNVFLGSTKINGSALSYNTSYPGLGNTYAAIQPGTQTIRISENGVNTTDSITILTLQKTLVAGSYYTLVITDSIQSARDSSRIWLQDNFPNPTAGTGFIYLRFIHTSINASLDTVDLFSSRRNQVLFSKIKVDSTTPFSSFPTIAGGSPDTFFVMKHGTDSVRAKLITPGLGDQQFFTMYYIGNTDTAKAKAAKYRALIYNQNK